MNFWEKSFTGLWSIQKIISALAKRKCIIVCLNFILHWELNLYFLKSGFNAPMYCKMNFTDISQTMICPNIAYYTKLKLLRIYNPFAQTTYLGQIKLLKIRRFKGSSYPLWCLLSHLNSPLPSQAKYI